MILVEVLDIVVNNRDNVKYYRSKKFSFFFRILLRILVVKGIYNK